VAAAAVAVPAVADPEWWLSALAVAFQVRLTDERWQHVVQRHREMHGLRERVLDTLMQPDIIQQGDFRELLALRFWPETPLSRKFIVTVYREVADEDGFILTAYLSSRPSVRRSVVWRR
jgi:hypothetical protein